jgi:hypothetical protein
MAGEDPLDPLYGACLMPVRAYKFGAHTGIFSFANRANTSTGIFSVSASTGIEHVQ